MNFIETLANNIDSIDPTVATIGMLVAIIVVSGAAFFQMGMSEK